MKNLIIISSLLLIGLNGFGQYSDSRIIIPLTDDPSDFHEADTICSNCTYWIKIFPKSEETFLSIDVDIGKIDTVDRNHGTQEYESVYVNRYRPGKTVLKAYFKKIKPNGKSKIFSEEKIIYAADKEEYHNYLMRARSYLR